MEHNTLEATEDLSSLSVPQHMRAALAARNTTADAPALDAHLHLAGLGSAPVVGGRHNTDGSVLPMVAAGSTLDEVLMGGSPMAAGRSTRRTASLLHAHFLKRNRMRSV